MKATDILRERAQKADDISECRAHMVDCALAAAERAITGESDVKSE